MPENDAPIIGPIESLRQALHALRTDLHDFRTEMRLGFDRIQDAARWRGGIRELKDRVRKLEERN
jgi:predicted phage tail protein